MCGSQPIHVSDPSDDFHSAATPVRSHPKSISGWRGVFEVPVKSGSRNALFTASCVVSGVVVCYFFIHVHDVIHYPGQRWLERQGWFRFLDRHHYLHHVDNRTNVNVLLPLCDWLFGTLKLELDALEARRWPTFEAAKTGGAAAPQPSATAAAS